MSQNLYIINCQGFYKIGLATDMESRLAQLSTGNPFPLKVEVLYKFENADPIERALHQRYKEQRQRGEWFSLSYDDLQNIHRVCLDLGGRAYEYGEIVTDDEMEEAEQAQETIPEGAKFNYAAMFADGWRMEKQTNGRNVGEVCKYWNWRRGSTNRETIYGGRIQDLPHSIEEMRRIYSDNLEPLPITGKEETAEEK